MEHNGQTQGQAGSDAVIHRWRVQLEDATLERLFRLDALPGARALAQIGLVSCILATAGFILVDRQIYGDTGQFTVLLTTRLTYLVFTAATMVLVHKSRRSARLFDATLVTWMIVTNVFTLYVTTTRPPDFVQHAIVNAAIVIVYFILIRTPLPAQTGAAAMLTIGEIALMAAMGAVPRLAVSGGLILSIFLIAGTVASWQLQRWQRVQFAAVLSERKLRAELQQALSSVQRLESILPICASCKKIRDENGSWHQVEVYVRDRTGTEFSHGLCPECAARLYGNQ